MRHEAADIAWQHAPTCRATWATTRPVVRARRSLAGEGLQVLVYAPDQPDLFARICGYFDRGGLLHSGCARAHGPQQLCAGHLLVVAPAMQDSTAS